MIKWKPKNVAEVKLIAAIVERAVRDTPEMNWTDDAVRTLDMDISACHLNGCPLDLQKLLDAPRGDFGHDVFGIRRFIDRKTGQLTDSFLPRCAREDGAD